MAIDVEFDRKFEIKTFATVVGAVNTMKISWIFMKMIPVWRKFSQDFHCINEKSQNPQLRT